MLFSSIKTCQICSKPLTLHERYAGNVCSDWRCRWRSLDAQLEAHRIDAAVALGEQSPESFPIAVVPFRSCRTVPVSEGEREELLRFLEQLLREISSIRHAAPTMPPNPPIEQSVNADPRNDDSAALLGKVCGVCEGYCCRYGATQHAFLDEEALSRSLAQRPGMQIGEVAVEFIRHVPEEHYEGSCIYHTKTGCNLPRDMRARMCNTYECRGLKDTRQHFMGNGAKRVFVVVRRDNRIMHSAFVDASGRRSYTKSNGDSGRVSEQ